MSLADPSIFLTENDDGSAELTLSIDDDNHKFSIIENGETARVSYEESLTWRGEIRTSEPSSHLWRLVLQSDEVTEYLESHDLDGVRRER